MKRKLRRCPFCNGHALTLDWGPDQWANIRCLDCAAQGPSGPSRGRAVYGWNHGEADSTCMVNGLADNRNDLKELDL